MKILVKYPTRGRPRQFLKTLEGWINTSFDPENLAFLVSVDLDDSTMTEEVIKMAKSLHPNVTVVRGSSRTKIEAINADIDEFNQPWDIVLVISDDMWIRRSGWDRIIAKNMMDNFPDTDGSLWFYDGSQRDINTLPCLGRKYYCRFSA